MHVKAQSLHDLALKQSNMAAINLPFISSDSTHGTGEGKHFTNAKRCCIQLAINPTPDTLEYYTSRRKVFSSVGNILRFLQTMLT
jgi:hypothetical protein